MQAIAEVYSILKTAGDYSNEQIAQCFERWQSTHLNSFLLEITIKILRTKDMQTGKDLVDLILDQPGSKGTAGWTLEAGVLTNTPLPTIAAAVYARAIFANKASRIALAQIPEYRQPPVQIKVNEALLGTILLQTSLLSFHQGLSLIRSASEAYTWNINIAEVCRIWQGGCIIRAKYLADLQAIYARPQEPLSADFFRSQLQTSEQLSKYLAQLNQLEVALPAINSAQDYIKVLTLANSPANLLQAQRDFFGQHTYERIDQAGMSSGGWE
jgi:6-phosphogluconate dehydrogenase